MKTDHVLFLLSAACLLQVAFAATYDYSSSSGKGPNKWASLFPNYCNKSSQSPIDIVTKNANYDSGLTAITYVKYATTPAGPTLQIGNNGHSFRVIVKPGTFTISGGGLSGTYNLHSFHFHWGSVSSQGSEHTVDAKKYPAELHFVHFNNKYADLASSLSHSDGLAVLGVLLEVGTENAALQSFLKYAPNVTEANKELYNVTQTHALDKLLPVNTSDYYRYTGSLTTPNCNEIVAWTVFKNPAKISSDQLTLLRSLKENNVTAIVNNYRPVQALNGRVVKTSNKPPVNGPDNGAHHVTNTLTTITALVIVALFKFF